MVSVDFEELKYPIVIEIPEDYWSYTINSEEKDED